MTRWLVSMIALLLAVQPAHAIDVPTNAPPPIAGGMRGMWVWQTDALLSDPAKQEELAKIVRIVGVTDLFVFMNPNWYANRPAEITAFLALMTRNHLAVWATDGCRCYLDDADGPAHYFAGIDGMLAYNRQATPWARFVGFHSDIEPQDLKEYRASFHNGIAGSKLNATGGGVWKASQRDDREALLIDWLTIQQQASRKLHGAGLRFGVAMAWWTENYEGEKLTIDPGDGTRVPFSQVVMGMVDDYVVMSYNTDPLTAADHVAAQAALASALLPDTKVRVSAAMETHKGEGVAVSYADTQGKQSKAMVLVDMAVIQKALERYPAFAGVSIEDWAGFHDLPR
jgi:hypothetical protein